jgi:hypothetical protein
VRRELHFSADQLNGELTAAVTRQVTHFDFSRLPLHAERPDKVPSDCKQSKSNASINGLIDAPGHRLEPMPRSWFEQRLGEDLDDVRVYRGAQADELTRRHGALAATIGRRIAINSAAGEIYTGPGLLTLAHELVHAAQQKDARGPATEEGDATAEQQAHALAPSLLMPGPPPLIHRFARPSLMFLTAANGQQSQNSTGTITADLTSPVIVGRSVHVQADLAPGPTYNPAVNATPLQHFEWKVFDRSTNAKVAEDSSPGNRKTVMYPRVGLFRIECTFVDPSKGVTPAMTLDQDVVGEDPALAGQLALDSDYSESERELVDDFRSYVNESATSSGPFGITSRFLASVLREEIANTDAWPFGFGDRNKAARETKLTDAASAIEKKASGGAVPPSQINRSLGVAQIKLSTAAMQQGLIPWIEQDPQSKKGARAQIASNLSALPAAKLADLHTLLAWPKSNIKTAADQLTRLKNRSNRYPSMVRSDFGSNRRACEIIATEYNVGATNSPESLARSTSYGQNIWSYMSLPLMEKFFTNR